jgi:tellurite resistance protein TerC
MLDTVLGGAPLWLWLLFHVIVFALLAADFFWTRGSLPDATIHRRSFWLTGFWISAALLFAIFIHYELRAQFALEYLTGYGIEEALSVDNLFVFLVLFRAFGLESSRQRRVLFYGVLGAILMRALMIFVGVRLLNAFAWMNYLFGAILLYTAWRLLREALGGKSEGTPGAARWLMQHLPVAAERPGSEAHREQHFFVLENGRPRMTPLFVVLVAVEFTDAMFAVDSIPAVLAVTRHPFIVYSSNIFAVLGLRSLYFTLSATLDRLHKLQYGLVAILAFVGFKMILAHLIELPVWISLATIGVLVGASAIWSFLSSPPASEPRRSEKSKLTENL